MAKKTKSKIKAKKTKSKIKAKSSVKSYQQEIDTEKQKMGAYSKNMGKSVKSLQGEFKKHSKEMQEAGRNMIAEGNKNMNAKVNQFEGEIKVASKAMSDGIKRLHTNIKNQMKENKETVSRIENGVKFFCSEVNKKKKDFQAYAQGTFPPYIKAFWG